MSEKSGRKSKLETTPALLERIVGYIEQGLTDEMAYSQAGIARTTFYRWLKENAKFSEAITHAREKAHLLAVVAFRRGLAGYTTTEAETETFSETRTRLNKAGEVVPYEYTRRVVTNKIVEHAPDWRAGEAWLKRRDPKNWSEKFSMEIDLEQLKTLLALLNQRNIPASELFASLIKDLADAKRPDDDAE